MVRSDMIAHSSPNSTIIESSLRPEGLRAPRHAMAAVRVAEEEVAMNIALVYYSKTGHSKKIANAIAAHMRIPAQDIRTDPMLTGVDLLFIVGGIYGGQSDPKMIDYVKRLSVAKVKSAALVTSSAGGTQRQESIRQALAANGIHVLPDEFICRGSFLFFGLGHPSKAEIDNAVEFAESATRH